MLHYLNSEENRMLKRLIAAGIATVVLGGFTASAFAHDGWRHEGRHHRGWHHGDHWRGRAHVAPPVAYYPRYYAPPVTYVQPPPRVYYPAPVYYEERPVYYRRPGVTISVPPLFIGF